MTNGPESADAQRRSRPAAEVPVDAPAGPGERESQQRARERESLRALKALAEKQSRPDADDPSSLPTRRQLRLMQQQRAGADSASTPVSSESSADAVPVPVVDAPPAALHPVREGGRRDRRLRSRQEASAAAGASPDSDGAKGADANADIAGMTVEQALAAREALQAQARNQVAAMEAIQEKDPDAVDLDLLAQQKALAERAAVLNRRTQNIQRISQENEQRRSAAQDPAAADNLAMVTPLEFIKIPGVDRPVMRPPSTSHIPIVTSTTPKQAGKTVPAATQGTSRGGDKRFEVRRAPASAGARPSRILARADAPVTAPPDSADGAKPVGARSAFGLDPLDVKTAGLGRTRRLRFVSLGIGGLGILALIISVAMIVGGFGS